MSTHPSDTQLSASIGGNTFGRTSAIGGIAAPPTRCRSRRASCPCLHWITRSTHRSTRVDRIALQGSVFVYACVCVCVANLRLRYISHTASDHTLSHWTRAHKSTASLEPIERVSLVDGPPFVCRHIGSHATHCIVRESVCCSSSASGSLVGATGELASAALQANSDRVERASADIGRSTLAAMGYFSVRDSNWPLFDVNFA